MVSASNKGIVWSRTDRVGERTLWPGSDDLFRRWLPFLSRTERNFFGIMFMLMAGWLAQHKLGVSMVDRPSLWRRSDGGLASGRIEHDLF